MQRNSCHNGLVPAIDEVAKKWELALAERFGKAVQGRRNALGLSAQQVAERTRTLGYPVTRVAISKIEGNKRSGKIDVAELIVLSLALEIPPVLLLFPDFPEGQVEVAPGKMADSTAALDWFAGCPGWQVAADNTGTQLIEAVAQRVELSDALLDAQVMRQTKPLPGDGQTADQRRQFADALIESRQAGIAALVQQIEVARAQLWRNREGGDA